MFKLTQSDSRLLGAALFSALLGLQAFLGHQLPLFKSDALPLGQLREKPNPTLVRLLSFGHLPAVVDWNLVQVLSNTSTDRVKPGERASVYIDLDLLTDLDPAFFEVYSLGANFLAVIKDDGQSARDLLVKAKKFREESLSSYPASFREEYWSREWQLPMLLGYVYLFELKNLPQASLAFQDAGKVSGAPPFLVRLSESLQKPGGIYAMGLRILNLMITGEKNPKVKEELEDQRKALFLSQFLFQLNEDFKKYRKDRAGADLEDFLRRENVPIKDPWGGTLHLDDAGRINTTTPRRRIFGMD